MELYGYAVIAVVSLMYIGLIYANRAHISRARMREVTPPRVNLIAPSNWQTPAEIEPPVVYLWFLQTEKVPTGFLYESTLAPSAVLEVQNEHYVRICLGPLE